MTKPHRHPLGNRIDPSIYYIYIGPKVDPHFKCIGNRATVIYLGTTLGRMCVILTQQKACGLAEPTDRSSPNEATPPSNLSLSHTDRSGSDPLPVAQIRFGGGSGLEQLEYKAKTIQRDLCGTNKTSSFCAGAEAARCSMCFTCRRSLSAWRRDLRDGKSESLQQTWKVEFTEFTPVAIRLKAIASRLEAIAIRLESTSVIVGGRIDRCVFSRSSQ